MKWLKTTSWPLYAGVILGSNLFGALVVMGFIRFLIPMPEVAEFRYGVSYLPILGIAYLIFGILVGALGTLVLFRPVLDWQRHPELHDPVMVRNLVIRLPRYQVLVCGAVWLLGIVVAVSTAASVSGALALVIAVSTLLTASWALLLTYLEATRLLRHLAADALRGRVEDTPVELSIQQRLTLTWVLTTGVPILGVVFLLVLQALGFFNTSVADILPAVVALCVLVLTTGFVGTWLSVRSVVDPIWELQTAINRVRRGDSQAKVRIYDTSEIGVLQSGFNEMMRGLKERQRVRDIFGRYVGTEVAQRALEERPTLGGEDRKVAVLFVDVIGSTTFAVNHAPEEVVEELNRFFEHVVETVHRHRGTINKFQGDAALAVFGAPLPVTDATSRALAAARELRHELKGMELQAGIGVAAGHVVAGHIGGHDRFEFTVIGDAVNQAARLTELAKDTPGRVLTSAATLRGANEVEQARWTLMKSIELRGRHEMTQLARPVRATLADGS